MKGAKGASTERKKPTRGKRKAAESPLLEFDFDEPLKAIKKQRASSTTLVPTPTTDSDGDTAMAQVTSTVVSSKNHSTHNSSNSSCGEGGIPPGHEFFVAHVDGRTYYGIFTAANSFEPFGKVCHKKTHRLWLRPIAGRALVMSNDPAVFMEYNVLGNQTAIDNARAAVGGSPVLGVYHTEVCDQPNDAMTSHIFSVAYNKTSASRYAAEMMKKRGSSEACLGETEVCNHQPNELHVI